MKSLKTIILGSCLCTAFLSADNYYGTNLGYGSRYNNDSDDNEGSYYNETGYYQPQGYNQSGYSDGPGYDRGNDGRGMMSQEVMQQVESAICSAISAQKRIQVILQSREIKNSKEMRVVTKSVTIEPYAFGMTRNNQPFLRGNIVEDKVLKEVDVKYTEDKFNDKKSDEDKQDDGVFSDKATSSTGWFSSSGSTGVDNLNLRRVKNLRILDDTHFDAPKNYGGVKDDRVQIKCELPLTNNTK